MGILSMHPHLQLLNMVDIGLVKLLLG